MQRTNNLASILPLFIKALFQLMLPFNGLHFRCQLGKAEETATPERRARHVRLRNAVSRHAHFYVNIILHPTHTIG